jgi:hypothetical protein
LAPALATNVQLCPPASARMAHATSAPGQATARPRDPPDFRRVGVRPNDCSGVSAMRNRTRRSAAARPGRNAALDPEDNRPHLRYRGADSAPAPFARDREPRRSEPPLFASTPGEPYVSRMAAGSARVRHIVELVAELSEDERSQREAELQGDEAVVGRAWGEEVDRRAARALRAESASLSRPQLAALLETDPAEARAHIARVLSARR